MLLARSPNLSFILSSLLSLHCIFPIYSKGKTTKDNNCILFSRLPLACPLPPGSQLQKFPTSRYPSCNGIRSHLLSCPIVPFFSPLFSSFVPHSSVVLSSHNKAMFSCVSLKPTLDLICPSNCCFISLSSVNSWNASFLVTGVPLLSPFLSYSAVTLPQLSLRYFMTF